MGGATSKSIVYLMTKSSCAVNIQSIPPPRSHVDHKKSTTSLVDTGHHFHPRGHGTGGRKRQRKQAKSCCVQHQNANGTTARHNTDVDFVCDRLEPAPGAPERYTTVDLFSEHHITATSVSNDHRLSPVHGDESDFPKCPAASQTKPSANKAFFTKEHRVCFAHSDMHNS